MQGKLIVLEGIDGSGKATQAKLLLESLSQLTPVTYFDFPRYEESIFGDLYARCLRGEFGNHAAISPYLFSLPLMLDRGVAAPKIREALTQGYVVCNRYTTSTLAHQTAKLPPDQREAFLAFVDAAEHGELGIPRPDFVIYLSLDHETADTLVTKKNKRNYLKDADRDQPEQDRGHQASAADMYRHLANTRPEWHAVECMEDGQILSPEQIHRRILDVVLPKLDPVMLSCMVKR